MRTHLLVYLNVQYSFRLSCRIFRVRFASPSQSHRLIIASINSLRNLESLHDGIRIAVISLRFRFMFASHQKTMKVASRQTTMKVKRYCERCDSICISVFTAVRREFCLLRTLQT